MNQKLGEYLKLENENICCVECGHHYCRYDENYKLHSLCEEADLESLQLIAVSQQDLIDKQVILRRFYCPGCGVNLENEVISKEAPPYFDKMVVPVLGKERGKNG